MVRILIIEDEVIIGRFLEQQVKMNFTCETRVALSVPEARAIMAELLPNLLLCDINLGDQMSGIELIEEFRRRYAFEVIFITSYHSRSVIEQAAAVRPANYIIKPIDEVQLFAAVQIVLNRIRDGQHTGKVLVPSDHHFSEMEWRILRLIRDKKTTPEIADMLHLSRYTIKNHRHAICRKLNLRDENNALLKWVAQNGQLL